MAADDLSNPPAGQGFPDVDPSSSLSGNRPASGARRATPGEVLSQGFQGAENAGDFLGLDTEFTGSQDPNQVFAAGSPLDLVPPPSTFIDDGSQGYAPGAPEPAPMPDGDAAQEFAQAPSAFEFGEDLGSDDGEAGAGEPSAAGRKPVLVMTLLVAALVAGGVFYGPQLYSRYFGPSTEVAVVPPAPERAPKPTSAETPAPTETSKPVTDPSASTKEPVSATKPSDAPAPAKDKEARKSGAAPRPTNTSPSTAVRSSEPDATPDPVRPETGVSVPTPTTATNPNGVRTTAGFPNLEGAEYEWVSADLLEMIWRGNHVPLEAVQAPTKTLMPRVGSVRVFTTSGDVFDGRLYAVGQNRVWVDAEPGRIGLAGDRIQKIEVLGPSAETAGLASGQEGAVAGKKRVRVRVPGGMLYGSVLKTEGEEVILALEDGGRVRVKASDIEDLGPGRAVVVRR